MLRMSVGAVMAGEREGEGGRDQRRDEEINNGRDKVRKVRK